MSQPFTHFLRVRYAECDAQNVVFNGNYAHYVDVAVTEFMRAIWGDYSDVIARGMDFQVVDLHLSWQGPARFDDVLAIAVHCSQTGTSSYTLALEFSLHGSDQPVAKAEIVYVTVDNKSFKKRPLPDDLKQQLLNGATDQISDHAGLNR